MRQAQLVLSSIDEKLIERTTAHLGLREGDSYQDQAKFLQRLIVDFVEAVRLASFAFTRYPESEKWLLQRETDGLIESAIAVFALSSAGAINPALRELRHMLEASTKFVYVDQQLPGSASIEERIAFLASSVARSSIDVIDNINFRLVNGSDFTNRARSTYSQLCRYVHPSKHQTEERLARYERGEFIGFEGAKQVSAFNKELARSLDLVLALVFEGIGPMFTGDLFESFLTKKSWKFHKTTFVKAIGKKFAYKLRT